MKKITKEKRGCEIILLIGLLIGMLTGFVLGFNVASWNFAGTIAEGYTEIMYSDNGEPFVRYKGRIYRLETVEEHGQITKKLEDLYNLVKEHEDEDEKQFEELKDKLE